MPKLSTLDNSPQKSKNVTPPLKPKPKPKKSNQTGEVDLEIKV